MTFAVCVYASPIGRLTLAARDATLCVLAFPNYWDRLRARLVREHGASSLQSADKLAAITPALDAYFAGDLNALDTISVEPLGSEFQRRAWHALRAIAPGETRSYAELARAVGSPTAVRAVGAANGANPISIVLPCHRVIGSDGSLTGYGGGLENKRWLLDHEQRFAR